MTRKGVPIVDLVLTTRELARMIKLSGLDLDQLEPEEPDSPFYSACSAGKLTSVAGGEAEATVRTLYHQATGREYSPLQIAPLPHPQTLPGNDSKSWGIRNQDGHSKWTGQCKDSDRRDKSRQA